MRKLVKGTCSQSVVDYRSRNKSTPADNVCWLLLLKIFVGAINVTVYLLDRFVVDAPYLNESLTHDGTVSLVAQFQGLIVPLSIIGWRKFQHMQVRKVIATLEMFFSIFSKLTPITQKAASLCVEVLVRREDSCLIGGNGVRSWPERGASLQVP
ncbi:hypothetical protein K449DRAFT_470352 [Hypoxylon sp. EC38]|nr:hypothetical protein K449DRAFT_470352 [Hypoxylon sp. EC38]